MSAEDQTFQLVYFPYLGLTEGLDIRFGDIVVWSSDLLSEKLAAGPLQDRIRMLLESHRVPSGRPEKAHPVRGIGVVSRGDAATFDEIVPSSVAEVQELRYALFLACLSDNSKLHGPNAAHYAYTAENFTFITQNFTLTRPYISEVAGTLVQFHMMGYRIGEVQFPTPTYVPRPYPFRHEGLILDALERLRTRNPRAFRRVLDATALFIESYHNTPSVDIRARILLQAAAFEVLLDLPSTQQRKAFKDEIEKHCASADEARVEYQYDTPSGPKKEIRSEKGIWADRFYTLRNHIIHGEEVTASQYVFKDTQHHVHAATVFFVVVAQKLLEASFESDGPTVRFHNIVRWFDPQSTPTDEDVGHSDPDERAGFRVESDWHSMISEKLRDA